MNSRFLFIEGTACTGKSTIVETFKNENRPTVDIDLYGACVEDSIYFGKHDFIEIALNFELRTIKRLIAADGRAEVVLCDRSPFASLLYRYIMKIMNKFEKGTMDMSMEADIAAGVKEMIKKYKWKENNHMDVIVFVNTVEGEPLDRMVKAMEMRKNNLDWISPDYVRIQNKVFSVFAKEMGFELIDVDFTSSPATGKSVMDYLRARVEKRIPNYEEYKRSIETTPKSNGITKLM